MRPPSPYAWPAICPHCHGQQGTLSPTDGNSNRNDTRWHSSWRNSSDARQESRLGFFFPSFCPRSFSSPSPILSEKKEVKNRDMQEEHKWWEDEWSFALAAIPCLMRYNLVKPSFISAANLVHREIQCGKYSVPQLNEERWRQMCHKIQLKQFSYVSTWAHVMSCKPCLATSMYKSLIFYP